MTPQGKNLVIISLPFTRVIRTLMYDKFIENINVNHDLAVVTLFGMNSLLTKEFSSNNVNYAQLKLQAAD